MYIGCSLIYRKEKIKAGMKYNKRISSTMGTSIVFLHLFSQTVLIWTLIADFIIKQAIKNNME